MAIMTTVSGGRLYDTKRWKRLRRMVLAKDPICITIGCNKPATDVDHIDGNNANNHMSNLDALCHSCHSRKTVFHDGGFGLNESDKLLPGCDANGMPTDPRHPWNQ